MAANRKILQVAVCLILSIGSVSFAQLKSRTQTLVLTHVSVIDATGAPVKTDMTVVINGDRITKIGTSQTISPPSHADVIDARGKFLIPGLWDMHVHEWNKEV